MRLKRPYPASSDEVKITREKDAAVIELTRPLFSKSHSVLYRVENSRTAARTSCARGCRSRRARRRHRPGGRLDGVTGRR